jgi:hypothetical protein
LNLLTKLVFTRKPFFVVAKPEREPMIRDAINSNGPANIRFVRVSYLRWMHGASEMRHNPRTRWALNRSGSQDKKSHVEAYPTRINSSLVA